MMKLNFKRGLRHRHPKPPLSSCFDLVGINFSFPPIASVFNPPLSDFRSRGRKRIRRRRRKGGGGGGGGCMCVCVKWEKEEMEILYRSNHDNLESSRETKNIKIKKRKNI